jgi:hypothetical protein
MTGGGPFKLIFFGSNVAQKADGHNFVAGEISPVFGGYFGLLPIIRRGVATRLTFNRQAACRACSSPPIFCSFTPTHPGHGLSCRAQVDDAQQRRAAALLDLQKRSSP